MNGVVKGGAQAALALGISAIGGLIGTLLGLPAGWLMGGALAVTIASLLKAPVDISDPIRNVIFVLIGMSMGATVSPDSLSLIGQWPVSLLALVIELFVIIVLTGYILNRMFSLDAGTSYLSAFPGHLSFVLGIAAAGVGNARQIVIIQVVRIFFLTVAAPIGALLLPIEHGQAQGGGETMSFLTLGLLAIGCSIAGYIFVRLKVPAGFVLGAMAVAIGARLAGWYDEAMPGELVVLTFIATGALIGSRFIGITGAEIKTAALAGLVATAVAITVTSLAALAVSFFVDMPYGQLWIGLAPGGLEGMGALGIALGYDTAFIAAHHVIRLMLLSFIIPTVIVLIRRQERRTSLG